MFAKFLGVLKTHRQSIRVIGTFLALIVAFYFVLDWGPIVDRVNIGHGLALLAAWMSWGLLRVLGLFLGIDVHLSGTIMGAGAFEVDVSPA